LATSGSFGSFFLLTLRLEPVLFGFQAELPTPFWIPRRGLWSSKPTNSKLPGRLSDDEKIFNAIIRHIKLSANVVLGILEGQLRLPNGDFVFLSPP